MEVVVGTYDGSLYGWEVVKKCESESSAVLEKSVTETNGDENASNSNEVTLYDMKIQFAFVAHPSACVKSLAYISNDKSMQPKILLSGATDEIIKIYDLKKRVEIGTLMQHFGAVTCIVPFGTSHVLTGSADFTICIWRTSDWNCVHILGGHQAEVTSIAVHPTGKLALSVSKDKTLRMWNLINGRCAYIRKFPQMADTVFWSPVDGSSYCLLSDKSLYVFNASDGKERCKISHPYKLHCAAFISSELIVCAGELGKIVIHRLDGSVFAEIESPKLKDQRVRSLTVVPMEADDTLMCLVLCTSNGVIQVYNLSNLINGKAKGNETSPIAHFDIGNGSRITSLCAAPKKQMDLLEATMPCDPLTLTTANLNKSEGAALESLNGVSDDEERDDDSEDEGFKNKRIHFRNNCPKVIVENSSMHPNKSRKRSRKKAKKTT